MLNTPGKNVKNTNLSLYIISLKGQVAVLCPDHIIFPGSLFFRNVFRLVILTSSAIEQNCLRQDYFLCQNIFYIEIKSDIHKNIIQIQIYPLKTPYICHNVHNENLMASTTSINGAFELIFWLFLVTKTLISFMRHLTNAIQSSNSLFHWLPCISSYTSTSSMSLGIT